MKLLPPQPVTLDYTNYKGNRAFRLVIPMSVFFGVTSYHPEPQWLMTAWDCLKQEQRTFAMKDIHSFGQGEVAANLFSPVYPFAPTGELEDNGH